MPLDLKNLTSITRSKITAVCAKAATCYPDFIPPQLLISPFQCLANLIAEDALHLEAGFFILNELLGGKENDLEALINARAYLIKASRIFLQFMLEGNDYLSPKGKNNSALHDALDCGKEMKNLVTLLLQYGANPDQENDDHLSPLAMYFQRHDKKAQILATPNLSSEQKMIYYIAIKLTDDKKSALIYLQFARIFHLFTRHPAFVDFDYKEFDGEGTLLHMATEKQSEEVVLFLLKKLKANPHIRDSHRERPIEYAANHVWTSKAITKGLNMMAHLFFYALPASWEPDFFVDELCMLSINNRWRKQLCQRIFDLYPGAFALDMQTIILSLLQKKISHLKQDGIIFKEKINAGTYGQVFKALHANTPVAIKLAKQPAMNSSLQLEAKTHATLDHPNIIRNISTIQRADNFGIVMEYAEGNLSHFIEYSLPTTLAACFYPYSKQMHAALQYLHEQNYVHLDFKTSNILILDFSMAANATLKIADFGATAKQGICYLTDVTTCNYCSPERFDAKNPYRFANDTFSFGVVLGELYTKKMPWAELTPSLPSNPALRPGVFFNMVKEKVCLGERTTFNATAIKNLKVSEFITWCWEQKPEARPSDNQIGEYIETHFKNL